MRGKEKRGIVKIITDRIFIAKDEITINLCGMPSCKDMSKLVAEGVGFEPTVGLPLLLISSQVPLTTQPPFHSP